MKKRVIAMLMLFALACASLTSCSTGQVQSKEEKIKPTVVIMPLFENGELAGDFPGEAQYFYEEYFSKPEVYDIAGEPTGSKFYLQGDVGLYILGQGKVTSAVNTTALLTDVRFDFSDTTFLVTGCAGSARDFGVVGDVYIITAAIDYDLGHTADHRDIAEGSDSIWFRIGEYDKQVYHELNTDLVDFAYELTKDIPVATTDDARACMARNFDNADWAIRDPKVLKGTAITSDNYWKGEYNHEKANVITEEFGAPDPYAASEMEDAAIALAFEKMGYIDQVLMLRCSVNVDVFIDGQSPERLWGGAEKASGEGDGFDGFTDIFPVALENSFIVGKTIIDALLAR